MVVVAVEVEVVEEMVVVMEVEEEVAEEVIMLKHR
jgi:hypothetical protein